MQPAQKIADLALLVGGKGRQPAVGLLHELRDGVRRFGSCCRSRSVRRGWPRPDHSRFDDVGQRNPFFLGHRSLSATQLDRRDLARLLVQQLAHEDPVSVERERHLELVRPLRAPE